MDTTTLERQLTPGEQSAVERLAHRIEEHLAPMLTADEASRFLRVRKPQLFALAREGIVPAVRVGRAVRFNRDQLRAWVESGGAAHPGRAM